MRNVLNWLCSRDGCFNLKCRLKFSAFSGVFPRKINFTNVDAIVEVGGRFCMLEWKGDGGSIKYAQDRAYKAFTVNGDNVVAVVYGDAEHMTVRAFGYYAGGEYHEAKPKTMEDLRQWLAAWATFADSKEVQHDAGGKGLRAQVNS